MRALRLLVIIIKWNSVNELTRWSCCFVCNQGYGKSRCILHITSNNPTMETLSHLGIVMHFRL